MSLSPTAIAFLEKLHKRPIEGFDLHNARGAPVKIEAAMIQTASTNRPVLAVKWAGQWHEVLTVERDDPAFLDLMETRAAVVMPPNPVQAEKQRQREAEAQARREAEEERRQARAAKIVADRELAQRRNYSNPQRA